ncbi:hypothetical protein [Nocardia sp. BMG51109]|nr:hypothetical protein [Nocardia sp. BMG51109]
MNGPALVVTTVVVAICLAVVGIVIVADLAYPRGGMPTAENRP